MAGKNVVHPLQSSGNVSVSSESLAAPSTPHTARLEGRTNSNASDKTLADLVRKHRLHPGNTSLSAPVDKLRVTGEAVLFAVKLKNSLLLFDLRKQSKYLRALHDSALLVALFGILVAVIEIEVVRPRQSSLAEDICRSIVSFSTLILLVLLYKAYMGRIVMMKARNALMTDETLWTSGLTGPLVLEILLCILHLPPRVRFTWTSYDTQGGRYETNDSVLVILMFSRLYLFGRVIRDHSFLFENGARFISALNNVDPTVWFVIKTHLKKRPLEILLISWAIILLVLSYVLLLVEKMAWPTFTYSDAVWFLFVSMTTVGFGDVMAHTILGRGVAAVCILFGSLSTALLVAVVHDRLQMSTDEDRVVTLLDSDKKRKRLRGAAATCIQEIWRWHRTRRRHPRSWTSCDALCNLVHGGRFEKLREWRRIRKAYRRWCVNKSLSNQAMYDTIVARLGAMPMTSRRPSDATLQITDRGRLSTSSRIMSSSTMRAAEVGMATHDVRLRQLEIGINAFKDIVLRRLRDIEATMEMQMFHASTHMDDMHKLFADMTAATHTLCATVSFNPRPTPNQSTDLVSFPPAPASRPSFPSPNPSPALATPTCASPRPASPSAIDVGSPTVTPAPALTQSFLRNPSEPFAVPLLIAASNSPPTSTSPTLRELPHLQITEPSVRFPRGLLASLQPVHGASTALAGQQLSDVLLVGPADPQSARDAELVARGAAENVQQVFELSKRKNVSNRSHTWNTNPTDNPCSSSSPSPPRTNAPRHDPLADRGGGDGPGSAPLSPTSGSKQKAVRRSATVSSDTRAVHDKSDPSFAPRKSRVPRALSRLWPWRNSQANTPPSNERPTPLAAGASSATSRAAPALVPVPPAAGRSESRSPRGSAKSLVDAHPESRGLRSLACSDAASPLASSQPFVGGAMDDPILGLSTALGIGISVSTRRQLPAWALASVVESDLEGIVSGAPSRKSSEHQSSNPDLAAALAAVRDTDSQHSFDAGTATVRPTGNSKPAGIGTSPHDTNLCSTANTSSYSTNPHSSPALPPPNPNHHDANRTDVQPLPAHKQLSPPASLRPGAFVPAAVATASNHVPAPQQHAASNASDGTQTQTPHPVAWTSASRP